MSIIRKKSYKLDYSKTSDLGPHVIGLQIVLNPEEGNPTTRSLDALMTAAEEFQKFFQQYYKKP